MFVASASLQKVLSTNKPPKQVAKISKNVARRNSRDQRQTSSLLCSNGLGGAGRQLNSKVKLSPTDLDPQPAGGSSQPLPLRLPSLEFRRR